MVKNKKGLGRGLNSLLGGDSYINNDNNEDNIDTYEGEVKIRKVVNEEINNDTKDNNDEINENDSDNQTADIKHEIIIDDNKDKQSILELDIDKIIANPNQPRTSFKEDELLELAESIKMNGLLQPILVCDEDDNGMYEVIAGERRLRACKLADMEKVPVIIKDTPEEKKLEIALIENIQREDLNPMEEAYSYKRILEAKGCSHSELATIVSKGRSTITNSLRLLDLPEKAQKYLYDNKITAGHARAILSVSTNLGKEKLTDKIVKDNITVREAESLANLYNGQSTKALKTVRPAAPKSYKKVAKVLNEYFGSKVNVKKAKGKNKIEIEFNDEKDLERITEMILKN